MFIVLRSISIQAGDRRLLTDFSWDIEKNEDWAILGATGSGKSTLAKVIAQKARPISGQILYCFNPADPENGRAYLYPNEIVVLSTETHRDFLKKFSGYHQARWQSLEAGSSPRVADLLDSANGQPASIAALIQILNLNHLIDREIQSLSHGESRKVHLAHLLLRSPRLLILDDPLVGLDRATHERLKEAVDRLILSRAVQVLWVGSRAEDIPASIHRVLRIGEDQASDRSEPDPHPARPVDFAPIVRWNQVSLNRLLENYARTVEKDPVLRMEEVFRLEDVTVQYEGVVILSDVHWVVRPGERWALLGPNGAGKTTLLSLILGDNPQAYANRVAIFGRQRGSGESIWEIKQKIGWVSPELQIHYPPLVTCLEVVCSGLFDSVGLYRRATSAQTSLAKDWLVGLGLENLANQHFNTLSAGEQRLALLARALMKTPPVLILDEPCQGLDDKMKNEFVGFLDLLCTRTQVTLIYVTHYQDEIPQAVTRRANLDRGHFSR